MSRFPASETLKLYRHLFRLCSSFSRTETLYFRDPVDNNSVLLRFDVKGAGIRALNRWLTQYEVNSQEKAETDVNFLNLPLPNMPSSMTFKREDLLDCVRHSFRKDADRIESMTPEQQEIVREMLSFRALCIGIFLDSQINLHRMSSITTTSFQALLPAEIQVAPAIYHATGSSLKEEGTAATSSDPSGEIDSDANPRGAGPAFHGREQTEDTSGSMGEAATEIDLQRLQHRLDSVQQMYKGIPYWLQQRYPDEFISDRVWIISDSSVANFVLLIQVGSANEFEALCMSAMNSGQSCQTDKQAHVATSGAGAELVPTVARVRIHAVPFPVRTGGEGEADVVHGGVADEYMLFQKQVVIENIGDAAVQLMGRWHKVTAPWESTSLGDKGLPHGHPSHGVLVMPGDTVMEQRAMRIRGTEGEVSGGFLCRVLPMDIAHDITKLYSPTKLDSSEPISMKELDPDTYFLAEFGPCKIRSSQALEGDFAQKLTAATADSDEEFSGDEDGASEEDDEEGDSSMEVFADKRHG